MERKQPIYAYLKDAYGVCRAACLFEERDDRIVYAWVVLNPSDPDHRPEAKDMLRKRFRRAMTLTKSGFQFYVRPFKRYRGLRVQGNQVVLELQSLQFDKIGYDCNVERFKRDLKQMREFIAKRFSPYQLLPPYEG